MAGQKEETTNTFSEGLIMDLNPLSTPNNVLTDCVNGTIITYNGNELILQNDMGNYKLKNAKLKTNFVPVGLKEYGGIIYIVSYNPLTKETEIGSYPSPQRIFSSADKDSEKTIESLINSKTSKRISYNDLSKTAELVMYAGTNLDDYLINPGDDFKLDIEIDSTYDFQTINFFILDKDKILTEIEIHEEYINNSEFRKVPWSISGWLCGKYRLLNFDKFSMYVSKMTYNEILSETNTVDINLNISFNLDVSDELLKSFKTNNKSSIYIELEILSNDAIIETRNIKLERFIEYGKVSTTYYLNLNEFKITDADSDYKYKLKATPYILYDLNTRKIIYDHLTTIVELDNLKVIDTDDIVALETYKYTSNYETGNGGLNLVFDIKAAFENNDLYKLAYTIYNLEGHIVGKLSKSDYFELIDINWFGQNTIDIPFENGFSPEEMYVFELKILNAENETVVKSWRKLMITTVLLNDEVGTNDYETISGNIWLNKINRLDEFDFEFDDKALTLSEKADWSDGEIPKADKFYSGVKPKNTYNADFNNINFSPKCTIPCTFKYKVTQNNFKYVGMFSKENRLSIRSFDLYHDNGIENLDYVSGDKSFNITLHLPTPVTATAIFADISPKLNKHNLSENNFLLQYHGKNRTAKSEAEGNEGDVLNKYINNVHQAKIKTNLFNNSIQSAMRTGNSQCYFVPITLEGWMTTSGNMNSSAVGIFWYEKSAGTRFITKNDKPNTSIAMMVRDPRGYKLCVVPFDDNTLYKEGWYRDGQITAIISRLNNGLYIYEPDNTNYESVTYSSNNTTASNDPMCYTRKIVYKYSILAINYKINNISYNLLSADGLTSLQTYIKDTFNLQNLTNLTSGSISVEKISEKNFVERIKVESNTVNFNSVVGAFNDRVDGVVIENNKIISGYTATNNPENMNKVFVEKSEEGSDVEVFCKSLKYDAVQKIVYLDYGLDLLGIGQHGKGSGWSPHVYINTLPEASTIKLPKSSK